MTDPLTADDLETIEQRANAATEGPWRAAVVARFVDDDGCERGKGAIYPAGPSGPPPLFVTPDWLAADAEFIAHARDDVPALLAEVRRLQAAEQRVRALHHPVPAPTSQHYRCEPYECDRAGEGELRDECGECGRWYPCPTIDALDGGE